MSWREEGAVQVSTTPILSKPAPILAAVASCSWSGAIPAAERIRVETRLETAGLSPLAPLGNRWLKP